MAELHRHVKPPGDPDSFEAQRDRGGLHRFVAEIKILPLLLAKNARLSLDFS